MTVERLAEIRARLMRVIDSRHVLELRDDGYGLQHPVRCRPNLIDCPVNRGLAEIHPGYGAGLYFCELDATGDNWEMEPLDAAPIDEVLASLADVPILLAEVDRLRAALAQHEGRCPRCDGSGDLGRHDARRCKDCDGTGKNPARRALAGEPTP